MFRPIVDLALLASAAALIIAGFATYPDIPAWMLAAAIGVAALLIAPVGAGHRTTTSPGVDA